MSRDYKKEYARDHASTIQKKHRAMRNGARRMLNLTKGDGKEVDHVRALINGGGNGKKNLRAVSRKTNRTKGRK